MSRVNIIWILGFALALMCAAAPVLGQASWYHAEFEQDLTGDGIPEVLTLTASGSRSDSLQIEFTISGGGEQLYAESWRSIDYLFYDPIDDLSRDEIDARVMARLEDFFRPAAFERLDADNLPERWLEDYDPRDLIALTLRWQAAERQLVASGDSSPSDGRILRAWTSIPIDTAEVLAIWAEIAGRPLITFTFSSGIESVRQIAWSERSGQFFEI